MPKIHNFVWLPEEDFGTTVSAADVAHYRDTAEGAKSAIKQALRLVGQWAGPVQPHSLGSSAATLSPCRSIDSFHLSREPICTHNVKCRGLWREIGWRFASFGENFKMKSWDLQGRENRSIPDVILKLSFNPAKFVWNSFFAKLVALVRYFNVWGY